MNPFIGRGAPVSGERLVGREKHIKRLVERVRSEAHCSIVGLPRLGKTSVAKEVLRSCVSVQEKISTGYITLDAVSGPVQAYNRILEETTNEDLDNNASNLILSSHDDAYTLFLRTLRRRKKAGYKGIVVIDEMDSVTRDGFTDAHLFISRLREIANDREKYGLTFIFVSRRSLDMIQGVVDCSTLAGLCEVIYMQPLNYDGLEQIMKRSPIPIGQKAIEVLWNFTGGHPFLSEVIMCEAVETNASILDENIIADSQHLQVHEFTNQYRNLQSMLSQESIFDSLCELVVGPHWRSIDMHTISLLKNYGLIRKINASDGKVECMSQHFETFLTQVSRMTPTWFLLGEVEKQLRYLVDNKMIDAFGNDWSTKVQAKYPQLKDKEGVHLVDRLLNQKNREKKQFGDAASDYLLDYAYIGDLKDLIFVEWDRYRTVFNGGKNDWDKRFQDVIKVRNPMAHNRPVPADVVQDAEKSCKVFLEKLCPSGLMTN